MENTTAPSQKKLVVMLLAMTLGTLVFGGLYLFSPQITQKKEAATEIVTNFVTNIVTNTVTLPAKIPENYIRAKLLEEDMTNASFVSLDKVLFGGKEINPICTIDDNLKGLVNSDELKAKFDLVLRRNSVPIDPESNMSLNFDISAMFTDDTHDLICYSISCTVVEMQLVFHNGVPHYAFVTTWSKGGSYGVVGRKKATEFFLTTAEKRAEVFVNDYLSANPKK